MRTIKRFHIIGAVFTVIIGPLLHFVYEWSGGNRVMAILGAVNESTWEHLKLLFWPVLFFGILEWFLYGSHRSDFILIKTYSILLGIFIIIVGFYTYKGILGTEYLLIDILIFIIAVAASYLFSYKRMLAPPKSQPAGLQIFGSFLCVLLITSFIVFTFYPPHIGLFQDPVTGLYGIHSHPTGVLYLS